MDRGASTAALLVARAEVAAARAKASDDHALIAHLKLEIEKLNRERLGQRSARPLDQLELQLEELAASASEDEPGRPINGRVVPGLRGRTADAVRPPRRRMPPLLAATALA